MTSLSSTARLPLHQGGSHIAGIIAGYLGEDKPAEAEDDLIFRKGILIQRLFSQAAAHCLDWRERLDDMRESIGRRFGELAQREEGTWPINGRTTYRLCDLDECRLFKMIIQQAPPSQKEFVCFDAGAGNFQWGENIANFINSQTDLPEGITVRIISTRAERYSKESIEECMAKPGRCKHIKVGCFKAEDFSSELGRCGLGEVSGKIDMFVSSMCMMHLDDPLGSFVQMVDSLRAGSGYLMMDRFHFALNNGARDPAMHGDRDGPYLMSQLLLDTRSPFLVRLRSGGSWPDFIVRRLDNSPCSLPMGYLRGNIGFSYTREPAVENPWKISLPVPDAYEGTFYGSKSLFDSLQHNGLTGSHPWRAIEARSV